MVKGITRQVILVDAPDKRLFEQAIFILREDAKDVTDEMLLKEARRAAGAAAGRRRRLLRLSGPVWALGGAGITGLLWLITALV